MKDKIAEALKKYHSNYGLGKEAIDGVASLLEKTITKEEDIESAVKDPAVTALLKAYQHDTDSLRTAKAKAEKDFEEYKAAHPAETVPPTTPPTTPPAEDPALAALRADMEAMKASLAAKDKQILKTQISAEIGRIMSEKGCSNEAIRNVALGKVQIADDATLESAAKLAEAGIGEYNSLCKSIFGDGAIPPAGAGNLQEGYKPGMFSGVIDSLRASGKLPQEQKK